jgi:adenylate cyclase
MSSAVPSAAKVLRTALEIRADSMSSAAQMALDELTAGADEGGSRHDLARVLENAKTVYRVVHEQLASRHFASLARPVADELHRIRHDLRNLLQNILLRCEMVEEDPSLPKSVRRELATIRENASGCVAAINASRDSVEAAGEEGEASSDPTTIDYSMVVKAPARRQDVPAHVLVADDNDQSRELLRRFLEKLGHAVTCAATGGEALMAARKEEFDLILLDLVMPDLNGFEVLGELRRLGILAHTPVILISGMDSESNAIRGIELGAEDFMPRPVNLRLLKARVESTLERQRLRERELAQYFTPKLARHLLRHPEVLATGRSTEVSVLFCDIVGFSSVSERLGPRETIRWVGAVLTAMSGCVMQEDGVLVDYVGDQVMALWGAPTAQPDHADRACRCAEAMIRALPELDREWMSVIGRSTMVTIGINTGEAFVGNIGTPQMFKFGALGNTVNLASRVQGACKHARASVLTTGATVARLGAPLKFRRIGQVRVTNIAAAVNIHEMSPPGGGEAWDRLQRDYEHALALFEAGEFHKASSVLGSLLDDFPSDGPSLLLMSRVVHELLRSDGARFDPVWELLGK